MKKIAIAGARGFVGKKLVTKEAAACLRRDEIPHYAISTLLRSVLMAPIGMTRKSSCEMERLYISKAIATFKHHTVSTSTMQPRPYARYHFLLSS